MTLKPSAKEIPFFDLFERFINDTEKGKRLQPNGKRISKGTIENYRNTFKLLKSFCLAKTVFLRIRPLRQLTRRETGTEKNYWKKFYLRFTDYLYEDCGYFDNYVGQNIKNIRVFFNYLNKELTLGVGEFHKGFYVRKEEIPIFPLLPEELNFLIYDKDFESRLSKRMREVKDFFVFGCTVALRCSDLFGLKQSNVRIINTTYYLVVRSRKTGTDSLVKLPAYAIEIIHRYRRRKKLLPPFNKSNLNKYVKRLLESAGFTTSVQVSRERRGETVQLKDRAGGPRLCDVACAHTMRRTAITTMLCLGVPEQVVRKISGHSPKGKEFYRYVQWAQTYQDQETERLFEKLSERKLQTAI